MWFLSAQADITGIRSHSMDTELQTTPTYMNVTRRVALLRDGESRFADSVHDFIAGLGLQVDQVLMSELNDLHAVASQVNQASQTCRTAVLVLESSVIQESFAGLGSGRTAELSRPTIALLSHAARDFEASRLVLVKQRRDPLKTDFANVEVCELDGDKTSAKAFRRALQTAGAAIEAKRFAGTRAHDFDFPEEWWAQELDGTDARSEDIPSFTEFLVDSVFNRELTQTKLKDETAQQIRAREPLDLKYHYVGWKAAKIWSELTVDQQYAHKPHIRKIVNSAPAFLAHINTEVPYNYVSLGPGGGDTDAELLKALTGSLDIASLFLVDVSIELLQIAANQIITQVLEPQLIHPPPRVRAVLADFEDNLSKLSPILMARDVRNLFTLLGFTIGNGSEMKALDSLSRGTRSGDYVLIDARLHEHGKLGPGFSLSEEQEKALLAPYDTDTLRAFAFSPVEEASDYAVRLSDRSVEVNLVPHWGEHRFKSTVPSAINVYVEGSGIYENEEFRTSMKIMPARKRSNDAEVLQLATLTFYDLDSLVEWIEGSGGFNVIWHRDLDGSALLLLERV
jgi:Histidine-specific methyltransferase, SAM-dependent